MYIINHQNFINHGFLSKTLSRSKTGDIRQEDNLLTAIEQFFANQKQVQSYEIIDNQNWVVNVVGSIHLVQSDLDKNGELWFKIGKLSGNLYFVGQHFKPSVIPTELDGEVIILRDEEELAKSKGQKGNSDEEDQLGMGMLTNKELTKPEILSNLKSSIADTLYSKYKEEIDIEEIIDAVKKQWDERDKFQLRIVFPERKGKAYIKCDIYVNDDDYNVPEGEQRKPLRFNAIQTAYYLMFVLKKEGLIVNDVQKEDWELVKNIYSKLTKRVEKTYITDKETGKEKEYTKGVKKNLFTISSIRSYMSEIRDIIHERISYSSIANEFAIEGYKGKPFGVARATDEMRAEIREKFGLD